MWLACLHVEDTKIIQEGIHLLQQVQTFGIHGISGVLVGFKLMGFQLRLIGPVAENPLFMIKRNLIHY